MKVVVATQQGGLNDQVSPMLGRAPTFTLVEVEDDKIKGSSVMQNRFAQSGSGAGIQAAQMLVNEGIKAVLGGNFGPNLAGVFSQAGIQMYQVQGETVENAVKKYLKGELPKAPGATGAAHGGMGMTFGGGMGRSMGGGMGGGRGMRMRQTMPQGGMTPPTQPSQRPSAGGQAWNPPGHQMSKEQELRWLNEQAQALEQQLSQIKERIEKLKE